MEEQQNLNQIKQEQMVDKLPYATVGGLKKVVLVPSRGLGLSG
jgi:hypothetical protein